MWVEEGAVTVRVGVVFFQYGENAWPWLGRLVYFPSKFLPGRQDSVSLLEELQTHGATWMAQTVCGQQL